MLDQITHLFRLRTILEEGSLRRASERLNVTQPALSRSLAQLESYFGQKLVERHARGVKATPFGERVLSVSNRIERYWEIAEGELRDEGSSKHILRIGAGPVWRSGILSETIARMHKLFPDLTIELTALNFGKAPVDLAEGRLDVIFGGVGLEAGIATKLVRKRLTTVTNHIMAREDHPLFQTVRPDGTMPEKGLLDYNWIVYTEFPTYREAMDTTVALRLGGMPRIRLASQGMLSTMTMLQRTDLLCLLPDLAVRSMAQPRIVPLPIELGRSTSDTGMLMRPELTEWAPMKTLVELCEEAFRD